MQLIPKKVNDLTEIETSIASFNKPIADLLDYCGLPTKDVLNPISERRKVIYALESTLEILPYDKRAKAYYLSKFTVAVTVGLFDGALTFLWDETIKSVRNLVDSFDLQYFFQIAETVSTRYKNLSSFEDLEAISEHDLLEITRRIGLVNDVNFKRLEHVNYLRNHASAAHPNENEVTGIELLSLLEHCLKHAITAKPDHSVIQIKQLLENLRKNEIPAEDFEHIGVDFIKQPQERINDFVKSIFGIYCDPRQDQKTKSNIEKLIPHIWGSTEEDTKYFIGTKFGYYRKNGDIDRKNSTQRFLEIVDGLKYKDDDSLAAELIEKLNNLRTVHFEWNNFYNEYPHAKSISSSIPKKGVPESVKKLFVKVITVCYAGNGKGYKKGVDENALPIYKKFIDLFGIDELKHFSHLFKDHEFVFDLDRKKADERIRKLVLHLKTKTKDIHILRLFDLILDFPKKYINKISIDSRYKRIIENIDE